MVLVIVNIRILMLLPYCGGCDAISVCGGGVYVVITLGYPCNKGVVPSLEVLMRMLVGGSGFDCRYLGCVGICTWSFCCCACLWVKRVLGGVY